mmetsp:Transcript_5212/g.11754  ORF Transcript_5212/g.11754 Transcript_5212/m.11754 type:complete len:789 (-) Transcript_5212:132-2498(-)
MSRRGVLSVYTPLSVSEFSHYAPPQLEMSLSPRKAGTATGRKRRYGGRSERVNRKRKSREEERKRRRSSAKGSSKAREKNAGGRNIPFRQHENSDGKRMDKVEAIPGEDAALDFDNVGSEFDFDEQAGKKHMVHHSNKDTDAAESSISGGDSDDESPVKPRKLHVPASSKRRSIQESDDETTTVEKKQTGSSRSQRDSTARKSKRLKQQTDDWDAALLAHDNGAEVEEDEFTITVEDTVLHEESKPSKKDSAKRKKGRKETAKKTPKESTPKRSSAAGKSTKKQVSSLKTGSVAYKSASVALNRGRNKFVDSAYAEMEAQDTKKDSPEKEPIAKQKAGRDAPSSRRPKKSGDGVELSRDNESDKENKDSSDDASEYEPTQKNSMSVSPKQPRTSARLKTKHPMVGDDRCKVVDKRNDSSDEGSEDEIDEELAEHHHKSYRREHEKESTKMEDSRKRMHGKTRGKTKVEYVDGQPRERTTKSMHGGNKSRKGDRIAEDEETVNFVSKTPPNVDASASRGKTKPKVTKPRDEDSDDEIGDDEKQDFEIFDDNAAVGADDDDADDGDDDDGDAKFPLTQADLTEMQSQFLEQSFSKSTDHSEDEASDQSKIEEGCDDKRAMTKHFKKKKATTEADDHESYSDDQAKASKLTPKISNGTSVELSTKSLRGLNHQDILKEVTTQVGSQSEEDETQDSSEAPESFEMPEKVCVQAEIKDRNVHNHEAVAENDAKSDAAAVDTATEDVHVDNIEEPHNFVIEECSDVQALNSKLGWHLSEALRCQQRIAAVNAKG